ncbi:MAG: hypothetical protein RB296_00635 [Acidobacteriota bacterium]|jgi:tetratricopeptide (TPR) repeat protein|nr:hypothetical protein [Acidobacteriota bacterium]
MLGAKSLRMTGMVVLLLFSWFTLTVDLAWAGQQSEGDELLKARQMYQQGDYEGSIKVLDEFIGKLKAIVAQKKNVAEAFYLLAKVYYTVGEDQKVDENLRKVFDTYPAYETREVDVEFARRVEEARQAARSAAVESETTAPAEVVTEPETAVPARDNGVIVAPAQKPKKKFPVLLVVGGVALVALLAVLLGGGSKDDKAEPLGRITRVKVRATVVFAGQNLVTAHKIFVNNNQIFSQILRFTDHYDPDASYETLQKKEATIFLEGPLGDYEIRHEVGPAWSKVYPNDADYWIGYTHYQLDVVEYDYIDGRDPGTPKLSKAELDFTVNPDDRDAASEWYRIEKQLLRILAPSATASYPGSPQSLSGKKLTGAKH